MATLLEQLFGVVTKKSKEEEQPQASFAPEIQDDGALVVASGGSYGSYVNLEGTAKTDIELINRYRNMALQPEVDRAIDDVINEAIVTDEDYIVKLDLDKVENLSDNVKKKIEDEFNHILNLMDFDTNAYETFRKWYIDGRLYYHIIVDDTRQSDGIAEIRYVDPRKIRKVREIGERKENGISVQFTKSEFYVYNDKGVQNTTNTPTNNPTLSTTPATGIKISPDAICYVTSGLTDENNAVVLSYLHKAIKPLNCLRVLEDATVIYRISRAPERRIFYIDVGNLPKAKADQYLRDTMARHKNRLVYDQNSGEIRDDRKYMTMQEDYWFARRDGDKGTEIDTLPPGQNLGELSDVEYFQKQLYMALNIPTSRLEPDLGATLGRSSEISRDEVKFSKFVGRMRKRFSQVFLKLLEKQLVLKNIILPDEWPDIARSLEFDFVEDNHFAELKKQEVMMARVQLVNEMVPLIGKVYSWEWTRRELLQQDDDLIKEIDKQIEEESTQDRFKTQDQLQQEMQMQQLDFQKDQAAGLNLGSPTDSQDDPEKDEEQQAKEDGNLGEPIAKPPGALPEPKPKPKPKAKS
jgi:hypothetical protein